MYQMGRTYSIHEGNKKYTDNVCFKISSGLSIRFLTTLHQLQNLFSCDWVVPSSDPSHQEEGKFLWVLISGHRG